MAWIPRPRYHRFLEQLRFNCGIRQVIPKHYIPEHSIGFGIKSTEITPVQQYLLKSLHTFHLADDFPALCTRHHVYYIILILRDSIVQLQLRSPFPHLMHFYIRNYDSSICPIALIKTRIDPTRFQAKFRGTVPVRVELKTNFPNNVIQTR